MNQAVANTNTRQHLPYLRVWRTTEGIARRVTRLAAIQRSRIAEAVDALEVHEVNRARELLLEVERRDVTVEQLLCAMPLTPGGEARQLG